MSACTVQSLKEMMILNETIVVFYLHYIRQFSAVVLVPFFLVMIDVLSIQNI